MAIKDPTTGPVFLDKRELRRLAEANHLALDIQFDPNVTAEQVQQMMLKSGTCPDDNEFSSEIIRARYRED